MTYEFQETTVMEQGTALSVRQNIAQRRCIRPQRRVCPQGTVAAEIRADNSFLREKFSPLLQQEIYPSDKYEKHVLSEQNLQRLVKAASDYLSLYGRTFDFTPTGYVCRDIALLVEEVASLLPPGQQLNLDYIGNEYHFIIYQSSPDECWQYILNIPISIAPMLRTKLRKLFIRFIRFMMQQNGIPLLTDLYDYDCLCDQYDYEESKDDFDKEVTKMLHAYRDKRGLVYRYFRQLDNRRIHERYHPLMKALKSFKPRNQKERNQVGCMVRGMELMASDTLLRFDYNPYSDDVNDYADDYEEPQLWRGLIYVSWGVPKEDGVVEYVIMGQNDMCANFGINEPYSYLLLSSENGEKLSPCEFPYKWRNYIIDDFYTYLTI